MPGPGGTDIDPDWPRPRPNPRNTTSATGTRSARSWPAARGRATQARDRTSASRTKPARSDPHAARSCEPNPGTEQRGPGPSRLALTRTPPAAANQTRGPNSAGQDEVGSLWPARGA